MPDALPWQPSLDEVLPGDTEVVVTRSRRASSSSKPANDAAEMEAAESAVQASLRCGAQAHIKTAWAGLTTFATNQPKINYRDRLSVAAPRQISRF